MKTKYIFLILCFLGIAMGSCKDDSASNPTFADDELYIYTDMLESVSAIAGTLTEFPILVSPADGSVSVKWLLDGEVIGATHSPRPEVSSCALKRYETEPLISENSL